MTNISSRIELKTNYYAYSTNFISKEILTNTFIEIENSTFTNAYWGTTNE